MDELVRLDDRTGNLLEVPHETESFYPSLTMRAEQLKIGGCRGMNFRAARLGRLG